MLTASIASASQYTKCLDILSASQARILRLYDHDISNSAPIALADAQFRANVIPVQRKPQAKAASRGLVANPFSNQPQVLQEWITLLDYPVPSPSGINYQEKGGRGMAGFNQVLKSVMIGRLVAAWISICGVSAAAKNADVSTDDFRSSPPNPLTFSPTEPAHFAVFEKASERLSARKVWRSRTGYGFTRNCQNSTHLPDLCRPQQGRSGTAAAEASGIRSDNEDECPRDLRQ